MLVDACFNIYPHNIKAGINQHQATPGDPATTHQATIPEPRGAVLGPLGLVARWPTCLPPWPCILCFEACIFIFILAPPSLLAKSKKYSLAYAWCQRGVWCGSCTAASPSSSPSPTGRHYPLLCLPNQHNAQLALAREEVTRLTRLGPALRLRLRTYLNPPEHKHGRLTRRVLLRQSRGRKSRTVGTQSNG